MKVAPRRKRPFHQRKRRFFIGKIMAKIYLVRHGESVANTQGKYQGVSYDTPLSVLGLKQAAKLAKRMKTVQLARIISSPLMRARETAELVSAVKNIPVYLDKNIIETNHGVWEGMHKNEVAKLWPHVYKKWQKFPSQVKFPLGEYFLDTQKRVIDWWERLDKTEDILIVTHDNIIRILVAKILNRKLNRLWKYHLQPTAITTIEVTSATVNLCKLNDATHLSNLQVNLELHAL